MEAYSIFAESASNKRFFSVLSNKQSFHDFIASFALLWERFETKSHNLGALDDIDKSMWVKHTDARLELNKVGTVKRDINHPALLTLIETDTREAGTTTFEIVDDEVFHLLNSVSNDEYGFVGGETFDYEVYDLTLDVDKDDGVDGEPDVADDECCERYAAVNDKDKHSKRNLGVLVDNHGDDVTAARSGTGAEYNTNGDTVYYARDNGVEEEVGNKELVDEGIALSNSI